MNPWAWLVIGLIAGWAIEFLIDLFYWRRRKAELDAALDAARSERVRAAEEVDSIARDESGATAEIERLREQIAALQANIERAIPRAPSEEAAEPLRRIRGIGPAYQQRLYDAGIRSFAQLATRHPDEIRAIVAPGGGPKIRAEAWIAEARALAAESEEARSVGYAEQ